MRLRRDVFVVAFSAYSMFAGVLAAGVNQWTVIGPTADIGIRTMAFAPQSDRVIYAVGDSGAARTDDRGMTWTVMQIPSIFFPLTIRISPSIPSTLYILGGFGDVLRSNSLGASWSKSTLPSSCIAHDLQIDPLNASTLFAACENFGFFRSGSSGGGVLRSTDGGRNWRVFGLKDTNVYQIALHPATAQIIYANTRSKLFKTNDGGASWREISPVANDFIAMAVVDPSMPTTIFAAAYSSTFKSIDEGSSWQSIGPPADSIAIDPYDSRHIIASSREVIRSIDGGETWQRLDTFEPGVDVRGIEQVLINRDASYAVFALPSMYSGMTTGQIFEYETPPPRRRAVTR